MWERACSRKRCVSRQMYWLTLRIREQARSHIWTVLSGCSCRRAATLVHTIRQQLRQINQLRNAEQFLSFRAFQIKRQVAAQRIGGGQVFVGKVDSPYKHFRTSWLAQPKAPALTSTLAVLG